MCAKKVQEQVDSKVFTSTEGVSVSGGGEGRIQQDTLIKPCPPPLPQDQRGKGLGVIR